MGIGGAVYILVNANHSVFYVGVTADLYSRVADIEKNYSLTVSLLSTISLNWYIMKHSIQ